jgi:cation transport ATPase
VRDAAAQACPPDATDTWSRRARWKLRHPLRAIGARINAWLHLDGLRSLWRQERLAQPDRFEALSQVTDRVMNDAEVARRYRWATTIVGGLIVVLLTVIVAVGLALLRLSLIAADLLIAHWVILVAAPVILLLAFIVNHGFGPPPIPTVIRTFVVILYAVAIPIVAAGFIGALAWLWWCALLVILLIWLLRKHLVARRRRRSRQSIVALLESRVDR